MLVNELCVSVPTEKNGEIVKPRDNALQFHSIDEKYRYGRLVFSDVIQKYILYILRFFRGHFRTL